MSFEVRGKDLLGRIGLLKTPHGIIETPMLLPVVNPHSQAVPAREIRDTFGFPAVITNAYLVWKKYRAERTVPDIHELLGFDGVVETDSGAYQILRYGDVEVEPDEIVRFQESLGGDMAVILDVPTGDEVSESRAKWTVDETIRRADKALRVISKKDILWVGPVQGGMFPELVAYSATEMAKRNFAIYAIGSPTPVMQQYRFDILVDMVMAAKRHLPPDRPLHLFGAGHPMMFAMAVALGCDIFDSASYALFARNNRYMTAQGTAKLEELEYFPCNCPTCHRQTPEHVRGMLLTDRERFLILHNLHSCRAEIQTIKQAVSDGRLWELVEMRAKTHPALQRAFRKMTRYVDDMESETPISKRKGPFITSTEALKRPEVAGYQRRLLNRYRSPANASVLLLIPEEHMKPFQQRTGHTENSLRHILKLSSVHVCAYSLAYGVIPNELDDVYPLSQTESAVAPHRENIAFAFQRIRSYLDRHSYKTILILAREPWQLLLAKFLQRQFGKRNVKLVAHRGDDSDPFTKISGSVRAMKTKQ